jgi:tetratricopeptide (TPR) repeat protein/thiol-disulfide isomerase/thioredoxin
VWRQVVPRTPASAKDTNAFAAYRTAWKATMKLLRDGHSFSGHERNCALLNCPGQPFANVSSVTGLDFDDDGRALGVTDWDQDGDLDVWILNRTGPRLRLLRNQTTDPSSAGNHNFVTFQLQGTRSNRDAIGARVAVDLADGQDGSTERSTLLQTLTAGDAFLSQSSKWLHFGLGHSARIAHVQVVWPSGGTERFAGIRPGKRYLLVEGSGRAVVTPDREPIVALPPAEQPVQESLPRARTYFSNRLPMPLLRFQAFDRDQPQLIEGLGQPLLLTLWASWCQPCLIELSAMTDQAASLREAGVQVLALSVDGLDATQSTKPGDARQMLEQLRFPFAAGLATRELLDKLAVSEGLLLNHPPHLAVPTSYLFDGRSELAVIYRGPVELTELLADVQALDGSPRERRDRAIPLAGRWLSPPRQLLMRAVARAFRDSGYDEDYVRFLDLDAITMQRQRTRARTDAERQELDRQFAAASFDLGLALMSSGDAAEARAHFQRAVDVQPKHVGALVNLGALLARSGQQELAVEYLARAVAADPASLPARTNLAAALGTRGRFADALPHYRVILAAEPDNAQAHSRMARALLELNDAPAATVHLKQAVELNSQDFAATLCLAWIQATSPHDELRDGAHAVRLARRLNSVTGGGNASLLDLLAAAYAEQGDFAAASATLSQALSRLGTRNADVRRLWQSRLQEYERHQPHRDPDGKYP